MGNYRDQPLTQKQIKDQKYKDIAFGFASMCGWRRYMQDAHIHSHPMNASQQISLFAIFDGHGGPAVALFVEKHFQHQLARNQHFLRKNYQEALKNTFLRMDQLIKSKKGSQEIKMIHKQQHQKKNAGQKYQNAGCTANVILITPTQIYCANAGDARSVASLGTNAEIFAFSKDHKPNDEIQKKRIKEAGGTVNFQGRVNGIINVARAIGDIQYKTDASKRPQEQVITALPDLVKLKRMEQKNNVDFIIMGCDGIWQKMSNEQMVEWIRQQLKAAGLNQAKKENNEDQQKQIKQRKLSDIMCKLLDKNIAKKSEGDDHGRDNMSAILIVFDKDRSPFPVQPVKISKPALQKSNCCPFCIIF